MLTKPIGLSECLIADLDDFPTPAILYHHASGKIIDRNKAATRLLGFTKREMRDITMLRGDDFLTTLRGRKGRYALGLIPHHCKDGTQKIVNVTGKTIVRDGERYHLEWLEDHTETIFKNNYHRNFENAVISASIVSRANCRGDITYVNDNFVRISGYSREELVGQNHRLINSAFHPRHFWQKMWQTIASGNTWRAEVRNRRKDGSYYWVDTFIIPFLNEDGKITEFLSIRNDITKRKTAEGELGKTTARLHETLVFGGMGSAEVELATGTVYASRELLQLLDLLSDDATEYEMEEFIQSFCPPESERVLRSVMAETPVGRNLREADVVLLTASGRKLETECKSLHKEGRAFVIFHDVTERKNAGREVAMRNNTIRNILESITTGFFVVDNSMNFVYVNSYFAEIAGMERSAMVGQNMLTLFPFMEQASLYKIYRQALATGKSATVEVFNPSKTDQFFLVNVFPHPEGLFVYFQDVSETRHANAKVKETNQLFQRLSENVPGMVYNFYLDKDGKPVFPFVSQGADALLGVSHTALMADGYEFMRLVVEEDIAGLQASIESAFYSNEPWSYEFRVRLEGGFTKWISAASNPYLEKSGDNYWYGFMHDITDRKFNQQRLESSELKNRMIIENSGEGILFCSQSGRISSVNPEACRIFNLQERELLSMNLDEILPEIHTAAMQNAHSPVVGVEVKVCRKDGSTFMAEVTSRAFVGPDGRMNATLIIRDISERKRAEDELNKLAMIARHTSNMVVMTDLDGHITWVNDGFERITGYSREEVTGRSPGRLLQGEETDPKTVEHIRRGLRSKKAFKAEILNYNKSGQPYWIDMEIMPIHDSRGEVEGFMAIQSDITHLKNVLREMTRTQHALHAFLNHAPMVAFMKNCIGEYTFFNKLYRDFMSGKQLVEGITDYDIFDKDFADECIAKDQYIIQTGETLNFEHHVGDNIFLEYKFPIRDDQDKIFGVGGISLDITEKIAAQRLVAEKEDQVRSITDHLSEGVIHQMIFGTNGLPEKFQYLSSGVEAIVEVSMKTMENEPNAFLNLIAADDVVRLKRALIVSRKQLSVFDIEYRIKTPSGKTKWLHTRSTPRPYAENKTLWDGLTLDITARKELELQIQASEAKLQNVFKCMNSGLVVIDRSGSISYANESAGQIMACSPEELMNNDYDSAKWDVVDENEHPMPVERIPLSIALQHQQAVFNTIVGVRDKNRERKWLQLNASPLFDESGNLLGAVAIFIDISSQKIAQSKLVRLHNELNAVLDASTDSTFLLDADYKIRLFNKTAGDAVMKIFGRPVKIGDSIIDYSAASTLADFRRNFGRALSGEQVIIEREIPFSPTVTLWSQVRYLPVYDNEGNIMGISFNATDITSRKRAEHALFESKQYFESLVNSQSSFLIRVDLNGNYTFANNKFCEKFGYLPENVLGLSCVDTVLEEDRTVCYDVMQLCVQEPGKVVPVTLRSTNEKGDLAWTEWEFVALQDESRVVTGFQAVGLDATQRVINQLELERVNLRLRMATQAGNIGVWEWNLSKGEMLWDQLICEMLGIPPTDAAVPEQTIQELLHPEDHEKLQRLVSALTPEDAHLEGIFRVNRRRDGVMRYLNVFGLGEFNPRGMLKTLVGIGYDITEQEFFNQKIQESEERFRTMADTAPVFIWMTDRNNKTTFLSKPWHDFTGIDAVAPSQIDWTAPIHPEDRVGLLEDYEEAFDSRTNFRFEYRLRAKDGTYRWFLDTGTPRFLDTGDFLGYIGSCLDITERKYAESQLAEKTAFLEAILSTADVGILACDEHGRLTMFNQAAQAIYEELRKAVPVNTTNPKARVNYQTHLELSRTLAEGAVKEAESTIESNGVVRHIVSNGRQLKNSEGRVLGAVVAAHDITVRKESEENLIRTLREKEVLIREIHHRIKNNLQLISSILYIKAKSFTDEDVINFLQDTRQKIKSIALIHERLLQKGSVNEVDAADYLERLIRDIRLSSSRNDVAIEFESDGEPIIVHLDVAIYCGLIVNELITNAMKHAFNHAAEGHVSVKLTRGPAHLHLSVTNNGEVMSETIQPGQTASFGMQMLNIFISQLNGELTIERENGTGFHMRFPEK